MLVIVKIVFIMSINHKCYCGHTNECDCDIDAEIIMKKFTSKDSTIEWINELVRVKILEFLEFNDNLEKLFKTKT